MNASEQKLTRGDLYKLLDFIEFCRCAVQQDDVVKALRQLDDIVPFQAGIVGLLEVSGSALKRTVRSFFSRALPRVSGKLFPTGICAIRPLDRARFE